MPGSMPFTHVFTPLLHHWQRIYNRFYTDIKYIHVCIDKEIFKIFEYLNYWIFKLFKFIKIEYKKKTVKIHLRRIPVNFAESKLE